jgi:acyl carrier protein phosphodiesterase
MNFLAHLYLSGEEETVMLGNFMADFVKGHPEKRLPDSPQKQGIIRGIRLHRHIDHFTDTHEMVRQSKVRLRPSFGKFAGVITDMFYDHLLAAHWAEYSDSSLPDFAASTYQTLSRNQHHFPADMDRLLYYMIHQNWLVSYAHLEGIDRALQGMVRRTVFESGMERAAAALRDDYASFHQEFRDFFPQLIESASRYLDGE